MARPALTINKDDVITAAKRGYTFKEIADYLGVSHAYVVKNLQNVIWQARQEQSDELKGTK